MSAGDGDTRLLRLHPAVQHYDWGSTEELPRMLGHAPDGRPWAEAWYGSHPAAPATLDDGRPLTHLLADPLPFLVKLLAAARPLSLQTHPDDVQARAGWDREERLGLDPADAQRNYRDPRGKPEAVLALTEFVALCGWRETGDLADLLELLAVAPLSQRMAPLLTAPAAELPQVRRSVVRDLLSLSPEQRSQLCRALATALDRLEDRRALDAEVLRDLTAHYAEDAGLLVAMLLEPHRLAPGESLFVPPGCPHSYLRGLAAEVMASSDNVLRGGLTGKHIDVVELVATLDGAARVRPTPGVQVPVGVGFSAAVLEVEGDVVLAAVDGPSLLLVLDGDVSEGDLALRTGQAALVPHRAGPLVLTGRARLLRVLANHPAGTAGAAGAHG